MKWENVEKKSRKRRLAKSEKIKTEEQPRKRILAKSEMIKCREKIK